MLTLDLEVVRQEPREISEVVQRRTTHAPASLIAIADRVLAFEQEWAARRFDPPPPEIRADQVGELPIRPLLEDHDLLPGLRQHGCVHRARRACADDDDVYFFVRHVTTSSLARCGAYRGCRGRRSLPSYRRPRRRHRYATGSTRNRQQGPASSPLCSGACC